MAEGGQPVPSVMYGLTSVHDDAFFTERAREMSTWEGVNSIYVEDAPGILKSERARTLLPAIRAAAGDMPLELHCHNNTGLAQHNYIIGLEAGFNMIHTASRPTADGASPLRPGPGRDDPLPAGALRSDPRPGGREGP